MQQIVDFWAVVLFVRLMLFWIFLNVPLI